MHGLTMDYPLLLTRILERARRHFHDKEIVTKTVADYGVDVTPRLKVVKVAEPAKRSAGVKVETAADLVSKLNTAGVL